MPYNVWFGGQMPEPTTAAALHSPWQLMQPVPYFQHARQASEKYHLTPATQCFVQ